MHQLIKNLQAAVAAEKAAADDEAALFAILREHLASAEDQYTELSGDHFDRWREAIQKHRSATNLADAAVSAMPNAAAMAPKRI